MKNEQFVKLPKLPRWFKLGDDGNFVILWDKGNESHVFNDINTALRQTIYILEQYGDEQITLGNKTIVLPGRITHLKRVQKIIQLLKTNIDLRTISNLKDKIEKLAKEIENEANRSEKIYFAVLKRALILKEEIIRSKNIIRSVYNGLFQCCYSLVNDQSKSNLTRIKKRISGGKVNLVNGLVLIRVNPYKTRVELPEIKSLKKISNIDSAPELITIIKKAMNRLLPALKYEINTSK